MTGIEYADPRMELGLVAEFEEREAAKAAFVAWDSYTAMAPSERAAIVAHYRVSRLVEMHANDAAQDDIERRSKRNGS